MRKVLGSLVAATLALSLASSAAEATTQVIPGSAPNMTIYIGDDGRLQGVLPGATQGMFFGADDGPASDYFYVRLTSGPNAGVTYSSRDSGFTSVSNGPVTGNFTPQSPAQNVTVFDVGPAGAPVARVTQTTLYVSYQKRFNVIYELENVSTAPLQFIAGTAADLYIGGNDSGTGIFIDGPRRFVGGTNTASLKVGGLQELTLSRKPGEAADVPVAPWASYGEGGYSAITSRLLTFDAFTNTIEPTSVDNGVGVSWADHATAALPVGETARYEVQWVAEQSVPLTASPAQASRELPGRHDVVLTLSEADGDPVPNLPIRYRINGVNASPASPSEYVRAVTNASGQVVVSWNGTTPGDDTVLAFADVVGAENGVREAAEPQASAKVTWLADNHVGGAPTAPTSLTGPSGSVPVGVVNNPENSEAPTFTFGRSPSASAGFPDCSFNGHSGRQLNFPVTVALEPGGGTIDSASLLIVDPAAQDPNATSGSTAPPALDPTSSSGNRRTFTVECVTNADLWVRFTVIEGAVTQTFVIPIGGLLLIDPQGVVYDRAAFDAARAAGRSADEARAAAAIQGATVRLQRRNANGVFTNVISGDPGIRPNVNPQTTAANGLYQWDVQQGTYRVVVTAAGFVTHESRAVEIPPPVLDLHIPMERPVSPPPTSPSEQPIVTPPGTPIVTPPGTPIVTPKPQSKPTAFGLKLPKTKSAKVSLSRKGVLVLGTVSCPKAALTCVSAKVTLRALVRGKGKAKLPAVLGTKTFKLKPGQTRKLVLRLPAKLTARLRARVSVRAKATVTGAGLRAKAVTFILRRG